VPSRGLPRPSWRCYVSSRFSRSCG
jgi:hypothetical protein